MWKVEQNLSESLFNLNKKCNKNYKIWKFYTKITKRGRERPAHKIWPWVRGSTAPKAGNYRRKNRAMVIRAEEESLAPS